MIKWEQFTNSSTTATMPTIEETVRAVEDFIAEYPRPGLDVLVMTDEVFGALRREYQKNEPPRACDELESLFHGYPRQLGGTMIEYYQTATQCKDRVKELTAMGVKVGLVDAMPFLGELPPRSLISTGDQDFTP